MINILLNFLFSLIKTIYRIDIRSNIFNQLFKYQPFYIVYISILYI